MAFIVRRQPLGTHSRQNSASYEMSLTLYLWRIKDKSTGRWRTLRWRMTESDALEWAKKEGVEIEQVENSAEASRFGTACA